MDNFFGRPSLTQLLGFPVLACQLLQQLLDCCLPTGHLAGLLLQLMGQLLRTGTSLG